LKGRPVQQDRHLTVKTKGGRRAVRNRIEETPDLQEETKTQDKGTSKKNAGGGLLQSKRSKGGEVPLWMQPGAKNPGEIGDARGICGTPKNHPQDQTERRKKQLWQGSDFRRAEGRAGGS